jgi:hypothetical protein
MNLPSEAAPRLVSLDIAQIVQQSGLLVEAPGRRQPAVIIVRGRQDEINN